MAGLEIQVPAGHDTAPLQPPRAVPCSITEPAGSHLQHRAPGKALQAAGAKHCSLKGRGNVNGADEWKKK